MKIEKVVNKFPHNGSKDEFCAAHNQAVNVIADAIETGLVVPGSVNIWRQPNLIEAEYEVYAK